MKVLITDDHIECLGGKLQKTLFSDDSVMYVSYYIFLSNSYVSHGQYHLVIIQIYVMIKNILT